MVFIGAFFVGGLICVLWQILFCAFKGRLSVTRLLSLGILVGAVLSATGVMPKIVALAEAGIMVMTPVAGDAVYSIAHSLLSGQPWSVALSFLCLIGGLYVLPFFFGVLRYKYMKEREKRAEGNIKPV